MIRLTELRLLENLTQKQLAEHLNISQGNLCDWEKGRSEPDIQRLIQLADFFNVSLDYLMGRENFTEKSDSERYRLLIAFSRLSKESRVKLIEFLEQETL